MSNFEYRKEYELKGMKINDKSIVSLCNIIEQHTDSKIKVSFRFKDGLEISFNDKNDIKDYDFANKIVVKISFSIYSIKNDVKNYFRVNCVEELFGTFDISYETNSEEEHKIINTEIDEWIKKNEDVKVVRKQFHLIVYAVYAIIFSLICVILLSLLFPKESELSIAVFAVIISVVSAFVFVIPLLKLSNLIFPSIEIDIGKNNHKIARKYSWIVLSVVIIPLIIGVILSLLNKGE